MRIDELLATQRPVFSIEFFPPKTPAGVEQLFETVQALKPLGPDYVSVTYGAGGATRDGTVEIAERIKSDHGIEVMAHLSCVGETRAGLAAILDRSVRPRLLGALVLVVGSARRLGDRADEAGFVFDSTIDVISTLARNLASVPDDRRQVPRVELHQTVGIHRGDRIDFVRARNVSQGGVGVEARIDLAVGDPFQQGRDPLGEFVLDRRRSGLAVENRRRHGIPRSVCVVDVCSRSARC